MYTADNGVIGIGNFEKELCNSNRLSKYSRISLMRRSHTPDSNCRQRYDTVTISLFKKSAHDRGRSGESYHCRYTVLYDPNKIVRIVSGREMSSNPAEC